MENLLRPTIPLPYLPNGGLVIVKNNKRRRCRYWRRDDHIEGLDLHGECILVILKGCNMPSCVNAGLDGSSCHDQNVRNEKQEDNLMNKD